MDTMMLESRGHKVDSWIDPTATFEFLAVNKYDILILDFSNFEDNDALKLLKQISKAFKGDIFLLDVYADSKLYKKGDRYGATEMFPRTALKQIIEIVEASKS